MEAGKHTPFEDETRGINTALDIESEAILSPDMPPEEWSRPKLPGVIEGETDELIQEEVLLSDTLSVYAPKLLDLVVQLGVLLMSSGAETYRVEDSIARVLTAYKTTEPSAFAVPSLIAVSFKDDYGRVYTKTRRVSVADNNLDRVYRLNTLSRYLTQHVPDLDYFDTALDEIGRSPEYEDWQVIVASGCISAGFNVMFGNTLWDIPVSFVGGMLLRVVALSLRRLQMNAVFNNIVGGLLAVVLAQLMSSVGLVYNADITAVSILMNLVPGALMTNAIRDIIATDYMSGITKLTQALMVAASLAVGAGVGYGLMMALGGGV